MVIIFGIQEKTVSEQQVNVRPDIAILERGPLYWWRLRIWDGKGQVTVWSEPSFFSLGLNTSDWKAKWITSVWKKIVRCLIFVKYLIQGRQNRNYKELLSIFVV